MANINPLQTRSLTLIKLFILSLVFGFSEAQAESKFPWPSWIDSHYPLIELFARGMTDTIEVASNGAILPAGNGDRSTYELIQLDDSWKKPLTCWKGTRTSGYIQTSSYLYKDPTEAARIAFPIHVRLKYESTEAGELAVQAPLFIVYVIELNKDPHTNLRSYRSVFRDSISIGHCAKEHPKTFFSSVLQQFEPKDPKTISVDDSCLTKPFLLETHKTYEIRVEWSGDQFCGELQTHGNETEVSLGDQIRILADPEITPSDFGMYSEEFKELLPQEVPSLARPPEQQATPLFKNKKNKKKVQ